MEPPVSDRSARLFEILVDLVDSFGFPDSVVESGVGGEYNSSLYFLKRVSSCWCSLLGTRGEYAEYSLTGKMLRKPVATGW